MQKITDPDEPFRQVVLKPDLIVRESTGRSRYPRAYPQNGMYEVPIEQTATPGAVFTAPGVH